MMWQTLQPQLVRHDGLVVERERQAVLVIRKRKTGYLSSISSRDHRTSQRFSKGCLDGHFVAGSYLPWPGCSSEDKITEDRLNSVLPVALTTPAELLK